MLFAAALAVPVLLATGLLPFLRLALRNGGPTTRLLAIAGWLGLTVIVGWLAVGRAAPVDRELLVENRPIAVRSDGYTSSETCRACHPGEYASWFDSYHRTMTQVASPETVLGDFNDVTLESGPIRLTLRREGDEFWAERADGQRWQIVISTGSHHMQVYWAPIGGSRKLEIFPFVWLIDEKRWITRDSAFVEEPGMQQIPNFGLWNKVCIKCHVTHGEPHYRPEGPVQWETQVAEFGISCEACHGPAEEHVALNQDPRRRYELRMAKAADPSVVDPPTLDAQRGSQVCGQCHSVFVVEGDAAIERFSEHGMPFRPGGELRETRRLLTGDDIDQPDLDNYFWADGMVRVAGREYTGMIESPCYTHDDEAAGILSCFSCHRMHRAGDDPRPAGLWADDQLSTGMRTNDACLQCHADYEDPDRLARHTYHAPDSTGSLCYDCHMPYTTYGLLKSIRSHQIDSPDVAVDVAVGRPNACNLCHLDETLLWTAEHLESWYGIPAPELAGEMRTTSWMALLLLQGDAGDRALAARTLSRPEAQQVSGTEWMAPVLAPLLEDPYAAVRFIAYRTLRGLPGMDGLEYDSLGGALQAADARRRVLELHTRSATEPAANEAVRFDRDRILKLLAHRDDRPVTLAE